MIVRIKSARDGYRRCGVAHPRQVTDHPADRFTEDELERLQADPVLTVTLVDGDLESIQEPSGGLGAAPAGASPELAPAPVPAAEPAPAPAVAPQKPVKAQKAPARKGSAKVNARGKGGAKAPAKEGTEAAQEGQSADDANSSAKPAEGEGSEGGQE
ncbi:HI1506-related protein [Pseudomonas sp. NBRC 111135]|uniref:HI1506-related protein n=1 Tax=Pseudomonas sp. NBRC 111135 TaxID=1661050 RepID=UPI0006D4222F|nr:HI1506-related protein [Pseudomonas sp. NBRC 111135]